MGATSSRQLPVAPEIAERAVRWLVDLQEGPASESLREACLRWRRADPEHERAWQHIEAANERLKNVSGTMAATILREERRSGRRRAAKLLVLAAVGGAAAWKAKDSAWVQAWSADFSTRVGERRTVTLPDGSQATLNTDSAIDLGFDDRQRLVRLLRGEMLVATAADASALARPFLAQTIHGGLRALGTRFSVHVQDMASELAVFDGAVELRPVDRPDMSLVVAAGHQVVLERDGWRGLAPLREGAGAWAEGMLVASGMPLGQFLAELARHRPGRVTCAPEVAHFKVSGTYPLADTDRILAALQRALPLKVKYFTRYWVSVGPESRA